MSSILLVDDDEDIVLFLKEMLEDEGYGVETSLSGSGAIEKAVSSKFDIMLRDYILTDMDGGELVDELIRIGCHATIYFLTGCRLTREQLERSSEVRGVLLKPVTYEALMAAVNDPIEAS